MQYFLPSIRSSLRSWSKNENGAPASVVGLAVSRLHALIVVARLKRKGLAAVNISALAAPGEIPDGIGPRSFSKEAGVSALHSVVGESVEVVGALRERLEATGARTLELGLHAIGLSNAQVSSLLGAVDAGQVVLWIEAPDRGELSVALNVFESNGVEEIYALPGVGAESRELASRKSALETASLLAHAGLAGAVLG